jgi:hypothetical protein
MNFRIEKITSPKLVDRKGRLIPTVRAAAINPDEAENQKEQTKSTEDQVLAKMLANPEASLREIARALGWGPVHEPAGYKVLRILQKLSRQKPRLTELERDRWVLTEAGKEVARKPPWSCSPTSGRRNSSALMPPTPGQTQRRGIQMEQMRWCSDFRFCRKSPKSRSVAAPLHHPQQKPSEMQEAQLPYERVQQHAWGTDYGKVHRSVSLRLFLYREQLQQLWVCKVQPGKHPQQPAGTRTVRW